MYYMNLIMANAMQMRLQMSSDVYFPSWAKLCQVSCSNSPVLPVDALEEVRADHPRHQTTRPSTVVDLRSNKSAHTALAVKACLLGGNSNTKCSMTFVNIAVAISALAGGGGPKTVSHRDQNTVVFATFFEDFWVSERKRVLKWNFGSFW